MLIKSAQEIESFVAGGHILAQILHELMQRIEPGITGIQLNTIAEKKIRSAGGIPAFLGYGNPPFPATLCVSINSCVVHGIPSQKKFKVGDIVSLDIGMIYKGFYTDMARTMVIEPAAPDDRMLVDATRQSLDQAIAIVKPGKTTGDIGFAVQSFIKPKGLGIVRDLAGHGVGKELHEDPTIPNFGNPGAGTKLTENMVIAIEPMITRGDYHVRIASDHWSVMTADGSRAAHFEDTILITKNGSKILTR